VERQQLQWVALAALVVAMAGVLVLAGLAVGVATAGTLLSVAVGLCLATLPVATGAAVLRYRLYDLDRLISRTLAYGLLTVLLGLGYAGMVLGLGRLLPLGSSLAVAAATLAVAAVFQPAVATFSGRSTGAATGPDTTPPARSRRSARACASRWT
jgi:hypothetical protein